MMPPMWNASHPISHRMNRMTIIVHSMPDIDYPPLPGLTLVVVVECDVEPLVVPVVELVTDHGCQTKIAMRIAISTTITMPTAAAPPPWSPPSCTTTGPSAIQVLAPFTVQCPLIPSTGKHKRLSCE